MKASLERTMADTSKSHLVGSIAKVDAPDANTVLITSVVKDRKVSGDEKSRTRDGDDAAIFA